MVNFYEFTDEQKREMDERTKKIEDSIMEEQKRQMPFVTWLYLVESRMCYIYGMDVACVLMMMMSFEELFRTLLTIEKYETPSNDNKPPSDYTKFVELLHIAKSRSWVTEDEHKKLDNLRKIRNKFTHVKKAKTKGDKPSLDGITRESMIAEIFQPSVDFDGIAEESIELIPIIFNILDRTKIYGRLSLGKHSSKS